MNIENKGQLRYIHTVAQQASITGVAICRDWMRENCVTDLENINVYGHTSKIILKLDNLNTFK